MIRPVSDEVWQRLDPRAGVLSRRTAVRMWIAVAVAAVLLVGGTLVWRNGIVVPRLVWPADNRGWSLHVDGLARIEFVISNGGWFPVTVLDVGRSAPGLELVRVRGGDREHSEASPFPVRLRPGEGVGAVLVYRVSDCDSSPRGDWPVTARVERPWGVMTVEVLEQASYQRWQEEVVDLWCDPQAWSIG